MKISLFCLDCTKIKGPGGPDHRLDFEESGLYRYSCQQGHESIGYLSKTKTEIIFEMGVRAFIDGYYRESISSFSSSLERSLELYLELESIDNQNHVNFSKFWKNVSGQSERQLGAFHYSWFQKYKSPFLLFDDKMVELRNRTIHKGHYASKVEAEKYGEYVLKVIEEIFSTCVASFGVEVFKAHMAEKFKELVMQGSSKFSIPEDQIHRLYRTTAIDFSKPELFKKKSFKDHTATIELFKNNFKDY